MIATEGASSIIYGELSGIISSSTYKCGALKSCMLNQENRLASPAGLLIPQFSEPEFGERQKKHRSSIDFHPNGQIKSAALDRQMPLKTPLGIIDAELITFYDDGTVNRIFPLNGQIDGYWSEANEREMADVIDLDLPTGKLSAKVISLHFYPSGALKTVTIWPGQSIQTKTPLGAFSGRAGLSFFEDGKLRSFEPAKVISIQTPIGEIRAFDPDIIGMHADRNSVQFNERGLLSSVTTIHSGVKVTDPAGQSTIVQPYDAASYIDATEMRTVPIRVEFAGSMIRIHGEKVHEFAGEGHRFETFEREKVLRDTCEQCPGEDSAGCCQNGGSCGGCSGTCA